jgi:hypothetical protein
LELAKPRSTIARMPQPRKPNCPPASLKKLWCCCYVRYARGRAGVASSADAGTRLRTENRPFLAPRFELPTTTNRNFAAPLSLELQAAALLLFVSNSPALQAAKRPRLDSDLTLDALSDLAVREARKLVSALRPTKAVNRAQECWLLHVISTCAPSIHGMPLWCRGSGSRARVLGQEAGACFPASRSRSNSALMFHA